MTVRKKILNDKIYQERIAQLKQDVINGEITYETYQASCDEIAKERYEELYENEDLYEEEKNLTTLTKFWTKRLIVVIVISLITNAILLIIYGTQNVCNGEITTNGYCTTERTIYREGSCPNGYTFYTTDHTCKKIMTSYKDTYSQFEYNCPLGYTKNENIYHSHFPGNYQCCYKTMIDKKEAKSRFYHWFN